MCPECYADKSRATPLKNAEDCLRNHRQYVCSTCRRAICASVDDKGRYRALFPFSNLKDAQLYLRSAEVITKSKCGIYEIKDINGRLSYKIFQNNEYLEEYLKKSKNKFSEIKVPKFQTKEYVDFEPWQLKFFTPLEAKQYLEEKKTADNIASVY